MSSKYPRPVPDSLQDQFDRAVWNCQYWAMKAREIAEHIKLRKEHNELYDRHQELLEMETRRMLQLGVQLPTTPGEPVQGAPQDLLDYLWNLDTPKPKKESN